MIYQTNHFSNCVWKLAITTWDKIPSAINSHTLLARLNSTNNKLTNRDNRQTQQRRTNKDLADYARFTLTDERITIELLLTLCQYLCGGGCNIILCKCGSSRADNSIVVECDYMRYERWGGGFVVPGVSFVKRPLNHVGGNYIGKINETMYKARTASRGLHHYNHQVFNPRGRDGVCWGWHRWCEDSSSKDVELRSK